MLELNVFNTFKSLGLGKDVTSFQIYQELMSLTLQRYWEDWNPYSVWITNQFMRYIFGASRMLISLHEDLGSQY